MSRIYALSYGVPATLAPGVVESVASEHGEAAARDARNAVEAGELEVVIAFHRRDRGPLTKANTNALRAFAAPEDKGIAASPPRKPAAKKGAAKKGAASR